MKEVWVKKTIYRCYEIADKDIETVEAILKHEPERAEELIGDIYDMNKNLDYDEEKIVLPVDYTINEGGENAR